MTDGQKVAKAILDMLDSRKGTLTSLQLASIDSIRGGDYEPVDLGKTINEVITMDNNKDISGLIALLKMLPTPTTDTPSGVLSYINFKEELKKDKTNSANFTEDDYELIAQNKEQPKKKHKAPKTKNPYNKMTFKRFQKSMYYKALLVDFRTEGYKDIVNLAELKFKLSYTHVHILDCDDDELYEFLVSESLLEEDVRVDSVSEIDFTKVHLVVALSKNYNKYLTGTTEEKEYFNFFTNYILSNEGDSKTLNMGDIKDEKDEYSGKETN